MKPIAKAIREATGLTLKQFCETHLESKWVTFSVRLRKNKLYPNEYIYICLITRKSFTEIFPKRFNDTLIFRGNETVSARIKELLKTKHDWDELASLLKSNFEIPTEAPKTDLSPEIVMEDIYVSKPKKVIEPKKSITQAIDHQEKKSKPEDTTSFVYEETY